MFCRHNICFPSLLFPSHRHRYYSSVPLQIYFLDTIVHFVNLPNWKPNKFVSNISLVVIVYLHRAIKFVLLLNQSSYQCSAALQHPFSSFVFFTQSAPTHSLNNNNGHGKNHMYRIATIHFSIYTSTTQLTVYTCATCYNINDKNLSTIRRR